MNKIISITALLVIQLTAQAQTLKEAIRLNENEQQDAASGVFQSLLVKEPANGTNYYYFGTNLIDAEKPDSAALIFNQGIKADPTNPLNFVGQAELKLQQGNMSDAKPLIDKALQMGGGKNSTVVMEAGEAYIHYKKAKDVITAQTLLEQAVKMDPKNPEVYNKLGDLYSELNNGTEAANNYNKALDLDKNQVKAVLHKGQLYKQATNFDGAITEFQNALAIDPNFAPAYRELGEVSFKQKKLDKAKEYYKKYLDLSKNNTSARLRYAYFLYESASYPESVGELNKITNVDSTNLGMMRIMAYSNYEVGKNDTALKAINKVFEITAKDTTRRLSRDYSYYGKAIAKAGNDSLGAMYVRNAISYDPKQGELYDDLADIFIRTKKYDQLAQAYSDKISNVSKPTIGDYFNMGRALYNAKDYTKADSVFAKVTELNATWPNGYLWRGRANALLDPEAIAGIAAPHYQKYIELAEADTVNAAKNKNYLIESYKTLAFSAFVKKECKKSIEYWNKVLVLDPEDEQAKNSVERIKGSKECK